MNFNILFFFKNNFYNIISFFNPINDRFILFDSDHLEQLSCSPSIRHVGWGNRFPSQLFMTLMTIEQHKTYRNELNTELLLGGHIQSTHNRLHCSFCSNTKAHGNLILSKWLIISNCSQQGCDDHSIQNSLGERPKVFRLQAIYPWPFSSQ